MFFSGFHQVKFSRDFSGDFLVNISDATLTRKNMNLTYSISMNWTNFWQPTVHAPKNIFEKTLIEVGGSHISASFGTFCVQIDQFLKNFENGKIAVSSKENDVDFRILLNVQRLAVSQMIDQLWFKRCQKKREYVNYKII